MRIVEDKAKVKAVKAPQMDKANEAAATAP